MGAPRNTPVEIINMLNNEINAGLANPLLQARLADLGGKVLPGSPADFGKLIADDTEKYRPVLVNQSVEGRRRRTGAAVVVSATVISRRSGH